MLKRVDVQSVFDIGKMVVLVTMLGVIATEALTLMAGITMVAFPGENPPTPEELGNTLSAILFGISDVLMLIMALRYFKDVQQVGTPFTHMGAQKMKNLSLICGISQFAALAGCYVIDFAIRIPVPEARLTNYGGLVMAAVLFVAAFVLEAGAKQEDKLDQYRQRIAELQKGKTNE